MRTGYPTVGSPPTFPQHSPEAIFYSRSTHSLTTGQTGGTGEPVSHKQPAVRVMLDGELYKNIPTSFC